MLKFCEFLRFLWTFSTAVFEARRTPVRLSPRRTTLLAGLCLSPPKWGCHKFAFVTAPYPFQRTSEMGFVFVVMSALD